MFYPYFSLSFLFFSFFYRCFPWQTLTIHNMRRERESNYFSCFPLPPADEHLFNLSSFLPFIFIRSICNYQIDSWSDFFSLNICIFVCIFMDAIKSEFLTLTFHCEDLSSNQTVTLLLQSQRLKKLIFTPPPTTVYLSFLPFPTPIYNSICPLNVFPNL